jgi:hypothetical protein
MEFQATLELGGKTATGIAVPAEVVEQLSSGKKPAVRATVNGYTYRTTVAPLGGRFMLPVSAEVRQAAGVAAGDRVVVSLALDTEPRQVEVPADLQAALKREPEARRFFQGLSYSRQRGLVLSIEGARTAETRQRRIDKAVASLRAGRV